MENKPNLFVITSALALNGKPKGTLEERIVQTLGTVYSIKANVDNVEIWILEGSHSELHESIYNMFPGYVKFFKVNELYANGINQIKIDAELIAKKLQEIYVIQNNTDSVDIYNVIYNSYIKSRTELFKVNKFLEHIDMSNYKRFYKISGRYMVSNMFKQSIHDDSTDSVSLLKRGPAATHVPEYEFQNNATLWGFDSSISESVKDALIKCENWIDDNFINQQKVVDIEHAFYQFFTKAGFKVNEIDKIGVVGTVNNSGKSFFYS
jgi:hypothetical protein